MTEQRYGYTYHRVLIESARILDPQFDDAVIYVTGAQLEMLRNMTQYLSRLSTYVSDYQPGYYLSPTLEDYDTIAAIVADLEETLMGNPNTLWGYHERWLEYIPGTSTGAGTTHIDSTPVPEGEVYVLERWRAQQAHGTPRAVMVRHFTVGGGQYLYDVPALPHAENAYGGTRVTMSEGDYIRLTVEALGDTKSAYLTVSGYKMIVPT